MLIVPQLDLDPPGTIGLVPDDSTRILMRFDEQSASVLPSDAMGTLNDANIQVGVTTMPPIVDGFTGRARAFSPNTGLVTSDAVVGRSLLTRNATVRAIVKWNIDAQYGTGEAGAIVWRGDNVGAAGYSPYAVDLVVTNAATREGEIRMHWQSSAGVLHTCVGGAIKLTRASEWMIITVTRRWVSSANVVVRYYVGSELVAEVLDTSGDIGGGTTGATTIGGRRNGGAWSRILCGSLDELQVLDRELSAEEIAMDNDRIMVIQPMGVQLLSDCLPPGWPITLAPDSKAGREHRLIGYGLGFAAAQAENVRRNLMPDRAYGSVNERWEKIAGSMPRLGESIEKRRARNVAHFKTTDGVSVPGVQNALAELLVDSPTDIEVIAYSNTLIESFASAASVNDKRWTPQSPSGAGVWTSPSGVLRATIASGQPGLWDGASKNWSTFLTPADGPQRLGGSYGTNMFAKLTPTTLPANAEAGIVFWDYARGNAFFFGIRRAGAAYAVVAHRWLNNTHVATNTIAATSMTPHWLHLRQAPIAYTGQSPTALVNYSAGYSTTSATAGFTWTDALAFPFSVGWVGAYVMNTATANYGGAVAVDFDDFAIRFQGGRRSFYFYADRDESEPGDYDLIAASGALRRMKQSHTHAAAIVHSVLCDDPLSGCDLGPCSG